jgi:hypothetical protein
MLRWLQVFIETSRNILMYTKPIPLAIPLILEDENMHYLWEAREQSTTYVFIVANASGFHAKTW